MRCTSVGLGSGGTTSSRAGAELDAAGETSPAGAELDAAPAAGATTSPTGGAGRNEVEPTAGATTSQAAGGRSGLGY